MPRVFISYVRENSREIEQLANALRAHNIEVWLDREQIKPGARWADAIRDAIADGDFFLACFSNEYNSRSRTYMNEELTLAIEELRQRPVDRAWFIPILLSDCEIPHRTIGAGETLRSIQWLELYKDWNVGIQHLASVLGGVEFTHPRHGTAEEGELTKINRQIGVRTAGAWVGMETVTWKHTLRTHAATIADLVALIRYDLKQNIPIEKLEARLSAIEKVVGNIQNTTTTAPLTTEEGVSSLSINDLIHERLAQLWRREPYNSSELQLFLASEESLIVRANPEWLKRAIDILIDNAVEAMANSLVKKLAVTTKAVVNNIEIAIEDTGGGIPQAILPHVFKEPIRKIPGDKGSGIGLLLAQTIVQVYGGDIRVGATGAWGTSMIIILPAETL
jgi:hypothetical protein